MNRKEKNMKNDLDTEIRLLLEDEEVPITTNITGLTFLIRVFGTFEIPFKFRNKEYQDEGAWLDGLTVYQSTLKLDEFFKKEKS